MSAYYNENDKGAAAWLRELIKARLIAPGEVDERSIEEVTAADLVGFTQCHFFAGIGGWSYALRLAGWPDSRPVWTGSCPCQPFSQSNSRKHKDGAFADKRHLWPTWERLIREHEPSVVFGEQVASPDGLKWFDAVSTDMEMSGYAVAAADLCAAGVGAPHIRQRIYWMAVASGERRARLRLQLMGYANGTGPQGWSFQGHGTDQRAPRAAGVDSHWGDVAWASCTDPSGARCWRPIEPGTLPVADGVPARVGRLRGYGNAIVPQLAATFVRAAVDVI